MKTASLFAIVALASLVVLAFATSGAEAFTFGSTTADVSTATSASPGSPGTSVDTSTTVSTFPVVNGAGSFSIPFNLLLPLFGFVAYFGLL